MGVTYSFLDVQCSLVGPGGAIQLGSSAGTSEEGITIDMNDDKDKMDIGADGTPMHSLHAGRSGTLTISLLKTSPINALLMALYDAQSVSSSLWGSNVITVTNAAGDTTVAQFCAFKKRPTLKYAKDGGMNSWAFNAGRIDGFLGVY